MDVTMMREGVAVGFLAILLGTLSACAGEDRSAARAKYSTYPENIRKAIDSGDIVKGMNQEQVLLSVGETHCVDSRTMSGKAYDSWTYHADKYTGKLSPIGRCPGDHPVIFENGYVIEGETK